MWRIWKEEVNKIISRKVVWCGFILLLAFITFRIVMVVQNEYSMSMDGKTYYGKEAIEKDKEIAGRYAGILTEETIMDIYKRYGFFYYDEKDKRYVGNYCSRFVTEHCTNYMQTNGNNPDAIHLYEGEKWENNVTPFLSNSVKFDYAYGWADLRESYGITAVLALCIIFIIGLSPSFSEEYTLQTADIIRTTRRGKSSVPWLKMGAALCFTTVSFCIITFYTWGLYLFLFGTQGLDASSLLLNAGLFGYYPKMIWGFFLMQFGLGLAGVWLLTGLVMGISACCKNAFLTIVLSLAVFLFPVVWLKVFAPMWILGIAGTRVVNHFMFSMPVYLIINWGFGFTVSEILLHLGVALSVCVICAGTAYHRFQSCRG